ncbi:uncharacterized protein [Dermacentor andersoni]|uniref:uncharacterized protein n=1 Tax=Dermacentor andersoni TaxID=34620 RepID=UPI003B3B38F5
MSAHLTSSAYCDVFLYCLDVRDGALGAAQPLLRLLGGSLSSETAWFRHWAAVFVYPDGKALFCDANPEPGSGFLVGAAAWRTTRQLALMDVPKVSLGRHRVTPDAVSAVLKSMCDSGHYHLTNNNCQEWVLELLRRLDIKIPEDSPPAARRVVREAAGPLALFGASLLSGALLLAGLLGSSGARRRHAQL